VKAAFHTLGCRLNQLETEALASSFRNQGFFIEGWNEAADIYVINTCTVTSKSEQKARRMIRKVSNAQPERPVVVTGCYAQMEEGKILNLGENVVVIPLEDKDIIQDLAVYLAQVLPDDFLRVTQLWIKENLGLRKDPDKRFRFDPDEFSFHSRGYLKIQDGCDNHCAYCRVTLARGDSVSLSADKVIRRLHKLSAAGYKEIVLTGVNIDSYRDGDLDLPGLFHRIVQETSGFRIRLSSLEPQTITEEFCNAVSSQRFCNYFHLSLQSGSDRILEAMNRSYKADQVLQAINRLRKVKGDPFIAADVIVGFPGETEKDFADTRGILEMGLFAWAHVFPYSSRPGTPAAEMKNILQDQTVVSRAAELRDWASRTRREYQQRFLGKEVEILIEKVTSEYIQGTSSNYLNCRIEGQFPESMKGRLIPATAEGIGQGYLLCRN